MDCIIDFNPFGFFFFLCWMACAKGSIYRANNVGDKQQLCLVALSKMNSSVRKPFILILALCC